MKLTDFEREVLQSHADGPRHCPSHKSEWRSAQTRLTNSGLLCLWLQDTRKITPAGKAALKEGTGR